MEKRTVLTATAITAGLLSAGCGDEEEPLTKAEFIEQADAICAATNEEIEPVFDAIWAGYEDVDQEDPAVHEDIFRRWSDGMDDLAPIVAAQLDDIDDLPPPAADQDFVDEVLAAQRADLEEFVEIVHSAADGDESARQAMETADPFVETDRQLQAYGLEVCGRQE
jgi:hypothetical protein